MNFTHTPASTVYTPDTFTDEDGTEYTVIQDSDTDDPREWGWDVVLHVFAGDSQDDSPEDHAARAFECFREANYMHRDQDDRALTMLKRWMRITGDDRAAIITTVSGYSQSDWCDVLVLAESEDAARDFANVWGMWFRGDVYAVGAGDEWLSGIYAEDMEDAVRAFAADR